MKILKLEIENYKKLSAFYQELNGRNLEVTGKAGVGKTTAVSSLWDIIQTVGEPLKKGARKGHIKIILGDEGQGKTIIAKREFTPKTSTPIILTSEGDKITMKEFQTFYSRLGVNPQEILEQTPKDFLKTILKATKQPEGVDIEQVEKDLSAEEQERTLIYREYETQKKKLPKEPEQVEPVDTQALNDELLKIKDEEYKLERKKNELEEIAGRGEKCKNDIKTKISKAKEQNEEIENLNAKIKEIEANIEKTAKAKKILEDDKVKIGEEYKEKQKEIEDFIVPDADDIRSEIKKAERTNEKAKEYERWQEQKERHTKAEEAYNQKLKEIKELKNKQKEIMSNSEFPLEGLSISEGKIYYQEILIENLGTSKKKLVSAAIAAQIIKDEGKLKVVRMDGVESMDSEDYNQMVKLFNENDIQVLSSRVIRKEDEKDDNEILIEEKKEG